MIVRRVLTVQPAVVEIVVTGPPGYIGALIPDLVAEGLIACGQVSDIRSSYRWEGVVEHAEEGRAALHTTSAMAEKVTTRIKRDHPYDVPCILVLPISSAEPAYVRWIFESVGPAR
ncbi:divalent-cation tolerance protein CutA [Kribbia dieselivorans]|uniref:divalent-cation tolerance protein CutA n=1 Tax=Kribbia dieselivorans TaxID=331526 RepID=UPI00083862EB|nr:divalent-cation tolerance protein CutA [Kribbia dieselivorans]